VLDTAIPDMVNMTCMKKAKLPNDRFPLRCLSVRQVQYLKHSITQNFKMTDFSRLYCLTIRVYL